MKKVEATAIFLFALAAALLLGLLFCQELVLPAEMAAHLYAGELICQGRIPYLDFFDNASPGLLLFSAIAAFPGHLHLGLHPILVYKLFFYLLFLLSSILVFKLAQVGSFKYFERAALCYLPFATGVFLLSFLPDFAHENLLFAVLLLPYLLLRLSGEPVKTSSPLWIVSFVLFSISVSVDPLFFLFYLCFELSLFVLRRAKFEKQFAASALLYPLTYLLLLAALPGQILRHYYERVLLVNLASFIQFNEYLYWVDKSPDRRDLIYLFVLLLTASSFALGASTLTTSFVFLSALGFAYYLCTVGLLTGAALPMLYFAMLAFLVSLMRGLFLLSRRLHWRMSGKVLALLDRRVLLVSTVLVFALSIALFFGSQFSLAPLGYKLYGRQWDLAYFSSTIEKYSEPGDRVAVFSYQARPGYPLLTQLARPNGSHFLYLYPFLVFRHLEMLETWHRKPLEAFEEFTWQELSREIKEEPPELILITDGDIRETLDKKGISALIEEKYDFAGDCSMLSGTEMEQHAPFEYLGYQDAFRVMRLQEKFRRRSE